MNTIAQPKEGEYPVFFETYLKLTAGDNYAEQVNNQIPILLSIFSDQKEAWLNTGYAPGKWSPKEVLGHIIDTERIMTYRTLCIARGDKSLFPGFDQDEYVLNANSAELEIEVLLEDFVTHRKAMLSLLNTLCKSTLDRVGNASGSDITPRSLLWMIVGHCEHHIQLFNERYL